MRSLPCPACRSGEVAVPPCIRRRQRTLEDEDVLGGLRALIESGNRELTATLRILLA